MSIYDELPNPKASYADAIARFDDYFKLRSSVLLRRKQFFEARQEPNENIMEYSCRLRRLINECYFQTEISKTLLRDIFRGFHQIPITESSQPLLAFAAPFGRSCYQHLPMGISSAPEVYQKLMSDLLRGINGAVVYLDDILIAAPTLNAHNAHICKQMSFCQISCRIPRPFLVGHGCNARCPEAGCHFSNAPALYRRATSILSRPSIVFGQSPISAHC